MEMAGLEPASPRCKRGALPVELHPQTVRTDGVEPPQRAAAALQAAELTHAQRPQERATDRTRTGTSRLTTSGAGRYTTATMQRAGTTGLEPATSRLTSERSRR